MGPWCILWLLLVLPKVLQGQTLKPLPVQPQLQSFQSDQFQGEWFVLGLASNAFKREDRLLLNPFSTNYELNNNGHFEVSNAMTRGKHCDTWSYVLMPTHQAGRFLVHNEGREVDQEDVQVVDSDYTGFALVFSLRQTPRQEVIRISLLGRNWRLPPGALNRFLCLVRDQGLTMDNNLVFPDVTELHLSQDGGPHGSSVYPHPSPRPPPAQYPVLGHRLPASDSDPGHTLSTLGPLFGPPLLCPEHSVQATPPCPVPSVPGHTTPGPLTLATPGSQGTWAHPRKSLGLRQPMRMP